MPVDRSAPLGCKGADPLTEQDSLGLDNLDGVLGLGPDAAAIQRTAEEQAWEAQEREPQVMRVDGSSTLAGPYRPLLSALTDKVPTSLRAAVPRPDPARGAPQRLCCRVCAHCAACMHAHAHVSVPSRGLGALEVC
jgi:hypothetical protein